MKLSILLLTLVFGQSVLASQRAIICATPAQEKAFLIEQNKVSFFQQDQEANFQLRKLAAIDNIQTKVLNTGFKKFLNHEGKKVKIRIKNQAQFSEVEDYISLTNHRGHTITYPLSCEFL